MKTAMMMTLAVCVALLLTPTVAIAQQAEEPGCCQDKSAQATECAGDTAKASCCASEAVTAPDAEHARQGKGKGKGQQGKGRGHGVEMQNAHTLVFNYQSITRTVQEIPGGVKTINTTTDPNLVETLRNHPKEMVKRIADGGHVRPWDPLFAELAKHADEVDMKYRNVKNGIEVISTSENPEVVKLIRAHAAKVSEFATRGRPAMREKTPLPDGYKGSNN